MLWIVNPGKRRHRVTKRSKARRKLFGAALAAHRAKEKREYGSVTAAHRAHRKNPRRTKRHFTAKQDRQAAHIAAGYRKRGVSKKRAKSIGYATVAKHSRGKINRARRRKGKRPLSGAALASRQKRLKRRRRRSAARIVRRRKTLRHNAHKGGKTMARHRRRRKRAAAKAVAPLRHRRRRRHRRNPVRRHRARARRAHRRTRRHSRRRRRRNPARGQGPIQLSMAMSEAAGRKKRRHKRGVRSLMRARAIIHRARRKPKRYKAARRYMAKHRFRVNPKTSIMAAVKVIVPAAAAYYGSQLISNKLENWLSTQTWVPAAIVPYTAPLVSVGTAVGLYYLTEKVAALKKYQVEVLVGAGISAVIALVNAFAPDSLKTLLQPSSAGYGYAGEYVEAGAMEDLAAGEYIEAGASYELGEDESTGEYIEAGASEMLPAHTPGWVQAGNRMARIPVVRRSRTIPQFDPSMDSDNALYTGIFTRGAHGYNTEDLIDLG